MSGKCQTGLKTAQRLAPMLPATETPVPEAARTLKLGMNGRTMDARLAKAGVV